MTSPCMTCVRQCTSRDTSSSSSCPDHQPAFATSELRRNLNFILTDMQMVRAEHPRRMACSIGLVEKMLASPPAAARVPLTDEELLAKVPAGMFRHSWVAGYRACEAASVTAARVPLTHPKDRRDTNTTFVEGYGYVDTAAVRAIERAHGIEATGPEDQPAAGRPPAST